MFFQFKHVIVERFASEKGLTKVIGIFLIDEFYLGLRREAMELIIHS